MRGVVLCGGKSSRMGKDKGLLKLYAKTWAQIAIDKLAQLDMPVVLSVNELQYEEYPSTFSIEQLIKDDNSLQLHGPLAGMLSVHRQFPVEDLFALACDMPLMEPGLLQELLDRYHEHTEYDAYIF